MKLQGKLAEINNLIRANDFYLLDVYFLCMPRANLDIAFHHINADDLVLISLRKAYHESFHCLYEEIQEKCCHWQVSNSWVLRIAKQVQVLEYSKFTSVMLDRFISSQKICCHCRKNVHLRVRKLGRANLSTMPPNTLAMKEWDFRRSWFSWADEPPAILYNSENILISLMLNPAWIITRRPIEI